MWVHEDLFPGGDITPFCNWVECPGETWDYGEAKVFRPSDTVRGLSSFKISYDELLAMLAQVLPRVDKIHIGTLSQTSRVRDYVCFGKRDDFLVVVRGTPKGVVERLCINLKGFIFSEPASPDELPALKELFEHLAQKGEFLFYEGDFQCQVSEFALFERCYRERYETI